MAVDLGTLASPQPDSSAMYSDKITFVIFAFNEERRIERSVLNFVSAGRVLVVDNHSTDSTREIATRAGASILLNKNPGWVEDETTAAAVKAAVVTPWVYWAYADEMVDRPTMEALLQAVESGDCSIVSMVRKNYYYGVFCHDAFAHVMNRAFLKDAIDFRGNEIHHFGTPTVPAASVRKLDPSRYFVHHFISHSAKAYLRSLDSYSDTEPKGRPSASATYIVLSMFKTFVQNYIVGRGYKAGLPGFFVVVQQAYYTALINMKRFESNHQLSFDTIEDRNDAVRDRLLKTFE